MIETAALFIFPILMAFAATSDLLTMTISNRISIALFVGFLAMAFFLQFPLETTAWHLSCGFAILCFSTSCISFEGLTFKAVASLKMVVMVGWF